MTQKACKTRPVLVPRYMQEFSCIGSACEDSCCVGWRVDVDEDTYKKYKKSRDIELKPLFEKNVTRQRSKTNSTSYAKIKMDSLGRCSFLSDENLCKVQLNLGEEFLSNTCTTYPRSINNINGVIEKSNTMSCPEAARLTLLNPNGIEFDQTEEPADTRGFITKQLETDNLAFKNKPQKYFWELRIFSIQVLQNRNYTLAERLIILGMFYQKVQENVDSENVHLIPDLIAMYTNILLNHGLKNSLAKIPKKLDLQMQLSKKLVDYRFGRGISSQRYLECIKEMLVGLQYSNESTVDENTKRYKIVYKEFYEPFIERHEYILENYLVNYVFKNVFPLGQKTLYEDYVMLVIHYSMIKLHLIGMSGFHKGLTTDLVIKLIQSFAKTVEHDGTYLNNVTALLNENQFNTMGYMAILINN